MGQKKPVLILVICDVSQIRFTSSRLWLVSFSSRGSDKGKCLKDGTVHGYSCADLLWKLSEFL